MNGVPSSPQMQGLKLNEQLRYILPDGTVYRLHAPPNRVVMQTEGFGTPPLEYVVDRAPFQHGDTVRNMLLNPRSVQIVVLHQFCSREAYWAGRAGLLDAIRPNRVTDFATPGKLLQLSPGRVKRQLDVLLDEGPGFTPAQQGWRAWSFTEVLRFTAHDPAWYDPTQQSQEFVSGSLATFPMTFPVVFSGSFGGSVDIDYQGTWLEYPSFTIVGPIVGPRIENVTTGEVLALDYSLPAGYSIDITLRNQKTITRNDGLNLLNNLSEDSDLTTWALVPDPQAPSGVNTLSVSGSSTDVNTSVTMYWYKRYFGI